ncbi:MAG: II family cellulose-binding protein [Gammaproteobacteria bacterium]|nr:MAG: II family cellulose-binding protein [Gammaproteobacteria bacterium]
MLNELTLTTPAMMFPAVSLLLLAYTNRYVTLSNRIRSLFDHYKEHPEEVVFLQIASMRSRLSLIRWMQVSGVTSLLLCVLVMFFIFVGLPMVAHIIFGISLLLMMASLILSVMELHVSNEALNILLSKIEDHR